MAKHCEICGKTPGRGPDRSATPTTSGRAGSSRTSSGSRHGQRRHPPHPRLHPLHPVEQGHQGRLRSDWRPTLRRAVSTPGRARRHRARTARPSGPATSCSSRARFRSTRPPARSSPAASPTRPIGCCKNLGAILARRRCVVRPRRQDDGLPGGHGRVRGDERGLRRRTSRRPAPARATIQAARPATRRPGRNRPRSRYVGKRLDPAGSTGVAALDRQHARPRS